MSLKHSSNFLVEENIEQILRAYKSGCMKLMYQQFNPDYDELDDSNTANWAKSHYNPANAFSSYATAKDAPYNNAETRKISDAPTSMRQVQVYNTNFDTGSSDAYDYKDVTQLSLIIDPAGAGTEAQKLKAGVTQPFNIEQKSSNPRTLIFTIDATLAAEVKINRFVWYYLPQFSLASNLNAADVIDASGNKIFKPVTGFDTARALNWKLLTSESITQIEERELNYSINNIFASSTTV